MRPAEVLVLHDAEAVWCEREHSAARFHSQSSEVRRLGPTWQRSRQFILYLPRCTGFVVWSSAPTCRDSLSPISKCGCPLCSHPLCSQPPMWVSPLPSLLPFAFAGCASGRFLRRSLVERIDPGICSKFEKGIGESWVELTAHLVDGD